MFARLGVNVHIVSASYLARQRQCEYSTVKLLFVRFWPLSLFLNAHLNLWLGMAWNYDEAALKSKTKPLHPIVVSAIEAKRRTLTCLAGLPSLLDCWIAGWLAEWFADLLACCLAALLGLLPRRLADSEINWWCFRMGYLLDYPSCSTKFRAVPDKLDCCKWSGHWWNENYSF